MARAWTLNGPDDDFLSKEEVAAHFGFTVRHLERLVAKGEFPRGILSGRRLVWTGLDIAAYVYLRSRCRTGPADPDPADDEDDEPAPKKSRGESP